MHFQFLFNHDDSVCYAVLQHLSRSATATVTKTAIADEFGLTGYQLNKTFDAINADLATLKATPPAYLDETTKGVWAGHGITSYQLQRIGLVYLQRSALYIAFEYRFLYSEQYTRREYVAANYLSNAGFYRAVNELDQLLSAHGFFSPVGTTNDEEAIIRLRLFQLYYAMYSGVSAPFPELDELAGALTQALAPLLAGPLPPTQATKLTIFFKVWLLRWQNGGRITAPARQVPLVPTTRATAVETAIQAAVNLDVPLTAAEFDYLYSFLIGQGFYTPSAASLQANFPLAAKLTQDFTQQLLAHPAVSATSEQDQQAVTQALQQLHLQFTTFFVPPTTFIDADQVSFFRDLYPSFDVLILEFIHGLPESAGIPVDAALQVNLYFSYMFALITALPPAVMADRVYVCVDFSQGTLYTDYVIRSRGAFTQANLIVTRAVDAQTDIYISDFHATQVAAPQVIWQDPPTPTDWSMLADMILTCKRAKLAALPD